MVVVLLSHALHGYCYHIPLPLDHHLGASIYSHIMAALHSNIQWNTLQPNYMYIYPEQVSPHLISEKPHGKTV
mgnify:CR=1 FL=1